MVNSLEYEIIELLKQKKMKITCAESCTGGLIIASLINISGASNVINESYITYSNESKIRILGVSYDTIAKYKVESLEVAREMVLGLFNITKADVCISVTGFAGGNEKLPTDGLCYYGIKVKDSLIVESVQVEGDRNIARINQKNWILSKTLKMIKELNLEIK